MALEPVENLVKLILETQGYFVQTNIRYKFECETKTGRTATYSDIDILAIKIDPTTGTMLDRLWGEVKAHLTCSLTKSYIQPRAKTYATLLSDEFLASKNMQSSRERKREAIARVTEVIGLPFRRCLYFGGSKPVDGGAGVKQILDPLVEIIYVRDIIKEWIGNLTHLEGNEDSIRIINMLSEYGLIAEKKEK
jgi:hypothetical protein